jgi:hypothetical protein
MRPQRIVGSIAVKGASEAAGVRRPFGGRGGRRGHPLASPRVLQIWSLVALKGHNKAAKILKIGRCGVDSRPGD